MHCSSINDAVSTLLSERKYALSLRRSSPRCRHCRNRPLPVFRAILRRRPSDNQRTTNVLRRLCRRGRDRHKAPKHRPEGGSGWARHACGRKPSRPVHGEEDRNLCSARSLHSRMFQIAPPILCDRQGRAQGEGSGHGAMCRHEWRVCHGGVGTNVGGSGGRDTVPLGRGRVTNACSWTCYRGGCDGTIEAVLADCRGWGHHALLLVEKGVVRHLGPERSGRAVRVKLVVIKSNCVWEVGLGSIVEESGFFPRLFQFQ